MTRHPVRDAALTLFLAVLSFGGSCVSDTGSGGPYNESGGTGNGGYDSDVPADRSSSDRPNRIPRWADVVREGTGKLRWDADLDGTVYVYDRDHDVIRYTGPVRRGDEVMIQPGDDRVSVAGRPVCEDDLRRDGFHQLYFAVDLDPPDRDRSQDHTASDRPRRDAAPSRDVSAGDPVPAGASRVDRGTGVIEMAKAAKAGTVYVYDEDARAVLYQTPVKKGTAIRVVPRDGTVYANGQAAKRLRLVKGHTLTLYFVN